jgi:HemY protein
LSQARWAFETLFKALVADYRWTEARDVLEKGRAAKHMEPEVFSRRRAVLMTAEADYWLDHGQHDKVLELSKAALKDAPDFAPAVAIAAEELSRSGGQKKAASLLEKSWKLAPHPALSLAYLDLYPGESVETQGKRLTRFVEDNPNQREARLLMVSHHLRADRPVDALSILTELLDEEEATARLCLLCAEAERALGNRMDAMMWTERASTASHELDWSDLDPEERQDAIRRPTPEAKAEPLRLEAPEEVVQVEEADDLARRFDDLLDDQAKPDS